MLLHHNSNNGASMDSTEISNTALLGVIGQVVSAYVSNNPVGIGYLQTVISTVRDSLTGISFKAENPAEKTQEPAVPVKKSVHPDYIVCLENGKKFKSLKRHLRTSFDMSPEEYRLKWNLPWDYPMVAPNYAKARSDLAKGMGLGMRTRG
jgi:predicted transcriptional regulator